MGPENTSETNNNEQVKRIQNPTQQPATQVFSPTPINTDVQPAVSGSAPFTNQQEIKSSRIAGRIFVTIFLLFILGVITLVTKNEEKIPQGYVKPANAKVTKFTPESRTGNTYTYPYVTITFTDATGKQNSVNENIPNRGKRQDENLANELYYNPSNPQQVKFSSGQSKLPIVLSAVFGMILLLTWGSYLL